MQQKKYIVNYFNGVNSRYEKFIYAFDFEDATEIATKLISKDSNLWGHWIVLIKESDE